MAHLRKRKDHYYAEFYDPTRKPERKWRTLRTKDRVAALSKMVELDRKYALGTYDPWSDSTPTKLSLQDVIVLFIKNQSHCVAKTIQHYRSVLALLANSVGPSLPIQRLDKKDIESFLRNSNWANATQWNYYGHIRTFCRWALAEGHIETNPVDGIKLPKQQKAVPKYLTAHDLNKIIIEIQKEFEDNDLSKWGRTLWLVAVVQFAFCTGLRLAEICRMKWEDVNLQDQNFTVVNRGIATTKTGVERTVPLVATAWEIIEQRRAADPTSEGFVFTTGKGKGPLNGQFVSKRFRHFRNKAGLPKGLHFHSLRHSFASFMVKQGTDLYTVKEILGHSSIEVTQKYAHLAPQTMRNQMDKAFKGMTI
jgi:site-specific recombinase XerD